MYNAANIMYNAANIMQLAFLKPKKQDFAKSNVIFEGEKKQIVKAIIANYDFPKKQK
jgi:hypothetical protein